VNILREEDLHALVDESLDETRGAALEAQLAELPQEAERVRAYRKINAGLRALYDPVLEEPVPPGMYERSSHWRLRLTRFAAAAGFVAVGASIGWVARGILPAATGQAPVLARQAAIAHTVFAPEVRHPVEVGADQQAHLLNWLSKRIGTQLKCPDLASLGYDLVGGRLLSGPNGPVAYLMFQDARGTRLTLYVAIQKDEARETAFRFSQEGIVSVFYWIDGHYGYALSGDMNRENLLKIANVVYRQLNP
jgi:anti-sigma factor RsiW